MPPNVKDKEGSAHALGEEDLDDDARPFITPKKEILYDGYFYDVTDFVDRHPGGFVIDYYTTPGEDATVPILEFHNRSKSKVDLIMKSLPRRKAQEHESKLRDNYYFTN